MLFGAMTESISIYIHSVCDLCKCVIFQKIVTDEHVLKMIQNSVESEDPNNSKDGEPAPEDDGSLTFEPKMTRSKVKDFIQKQGSVRCVFTLTECSNIFSPSLIGEL